MGRIKDKKKHDYWNIFIGGLLQEEYEPHGIFKLYDKVNSLDKYNSYVEFYTWNENWYAVARKIYLISQLHGKQPVINICGYSWGTWGLKQLCKHLSHFGFTVENAVMTDPIFKMKFFPVLTLFSKEVYMPANIEHIYYFKQENAWPKGHDVYKENSYGWEKVEPVLLVTDKEIRHEDMDDLEDFHKLTIDKMIYGV